MPGHQEVLKDYQQLYISHNAKPAARAFLEAAALVEAHDLDGAKSRGDEASEILETAQGANRAWNQLRATLDSLKTTHPPRIELIRRLLIQELAENDQLDLGEILPLATTESAALPEPRPVDVPDCVGTHESVASLISAETESKSATAEPAVSPVRRTRKEGELGHREEAILIAGVEFNDDRTNWRYSTPKSLCEAAYKEVLDRLNLNEQNKRLGVYLCTLRQGMAGSIASKVRGAIVNPTSTPEYTRLLVADLLSDPDLDSVLREQLPDLIRDILINRTFPFKRVAKENPPQSPQSEQLTAKDKANLTHILLNLPPEERTNLGIDDEELDGIRQIAKKANQELGHNPGVTRLPDVQDKERVTSLLTAYTDQKTKIFEANLGDNDAQELLVLLAHLDSPEQVNRLLKYT